MTNKQFNYIISRLRRDIWESLGNKAFKIKDCTMDDLMVITVDDLYQTLDMYFNELKEDKEGL